MYEGKISKRLMIIGSKGEQAIKISVKCHGFNVEDRSIRVSSMTTLKYGDIGIKAFRISEDEIFKLETKDSSSSGYPPSIN
jgi:hypothetical protein